MTGFFELMHLLKLNYYVSAPQSYIIKTGLGINDMEISKSTLKLPFQKVTHINTNPYNVELDAIVTTSDLYPIKIPAFFTIGINANTNDERLTKINIQKYVSFYVKNDAHTKKTILKNMIESAIIEQMNKYKLIDIVINRNEIISSIVYTLNENLNIYGLITHCSNIKNITEPNTQLYFLKELKSLMPSNYNMYNVSNGNNHTIIDNQTEVDNQTAISDPVVNEKVKPPSIENKPVNKEVKNNNQFLISEVHNYLKNKNAELNNVN